MSSMRGRRIRGVLLVSTGVLLTLFVATGCGGDEVDTGETWWRDHAHKDPGNAYQISYPPTWKAEHRSDDDGTVARFTVPDDPDVEVVIRVDETEADTMLPVEEFVKAYGGDVEGFTVHESEATTCGAAAAIRLKFSQGSAPDVKTALAFLILDRGRLYFVLGHAPEDSFATYESAIDSMGYSWQPTLSE